MLAGCDPVKPDKDQWPLSLKELVPNAGAAQRDPGEAVYRRTCVSCHGVDGRGNDQKVAADFTRPDGVLTHRDQELLEVIRNGERGKIGVMPPHGGMLTEEQITAVLGYVRRTFGKGIVAAAASAAPGEPSSEGPEPQAPAPSAR